MLKNIKEDIAYVGLSIKREIIIFSSINIILITSIVLMFVFNVTKFVIFMYMVFIPLIDYIYVSRYKSLVKKVNDNHNFEFVSLLSYFEIFISNHNNVYKSFEMLVPYASDWMNLRITNMLKEIDLDKSVTPYINFSKNFTYLVIENVMISIYQMVEQGEDESNLLQFDYVFSSLSNSLMDTKIDNHQKSIDSMNAFPLIGAGLITITLTLSIIAILGELINVI